MVSTLNQGNEVLGDCEIRLESQEKILILQDEKGLSSWNLEDRLQPLCLYSTCVDSSKVMVLEKGDRMVVVANNMLYEVDLKDNTRVLKEVSIPSLGQTQFEVVGNGDLLLVASADVEQVSFRKNKVFLTKQKTQNRVLFVDMDSVTNQNQHLIEAFLNGETAGSDSAKEPVKVYEVHTMEENIVASNLLLTKGFSAPFLFENEHVLSDQEFYNRMSQELEWEGRLYLGTEQGNCYVVSFSVDQSQAFSAAVKMVVKNGHL